MSTVICPGTFDPVTNGHLDVIFRAAQMYEKVIVGVAKDSSKKPFFSLEERISFIEDEISGKNNIEVESFDSLVVKFANKHQAKAIIKGLRAVSDFEHEFQMAQLNKRLAEKVETVFIMATPKYAYLSSSAVKEIASFGGDISGLVPKKVKSRLQARNGVGG
ncbi:MAG: pantetheine-phosphate adenylyltransferase [Actinobacteria bacterium]|nr:MAG: pantetheine-phosphate adenylyltransferase [Actinomycetota bacterium]